MTASISNTAKFLTCLYEDDFKNESFEPFRITWQQLRSIAGVVRLTEQYLCGVNRELNNSSYTLITCDDYFVVARECDLFQFRSIPDRIIERHLDGRTKNEINNSEDIEIDDVDVKESQHVSRVQDYT